MSWVRSVTAENTGKPTDLEALAVQAATGDMTATSHLLERLRPRIVRLVGSLVTVGDAQRDDIVQQALIAITHALPAFRGDAPIWHYVSRIALRKTLVAVRRDRKESERHERLLVSHGGPTHTEPPASVETRERRQALKALLETLPEEQAETLAMRVSLGWTLAEVARATGVPPNTVRSRIRLAREALRARIEADPRLAELFEATS